MVKNSSQINYVIKTRFTESRGYIVESKRGGGGHIRAGKKSSFLITIRCPRFGSQYWETISQQVFNDILRDALWRKIIDKTWSSACLRRPPDEVPRVECSHPTSNDAEKIIQKVDRKRKYRLDELFNSTVRKYRSGPNTSWPLSGHTLDTWHLLTAMANNPYSVAGSVLNDYPMQIDELQDAAEHITASFQSDNRYEIFPFSYRMEAIMKHARECPGPSCQDLGNRACAPSLQQTVGPWRVKSWSLPALPLQSKTREFLLPPFVKNLEDKAGWDKNDIKAIRSLYRAQNPNRQTMEIWWACPSAPVEVLKIIPVIWQKWRVQASLSLWLVGMQRFHAWSKSSAARRRTILYWWEKQGSEEAALALGLAQRVASGNVPAENRAQMRVLESISWMSLLGRASRGDSKNGWTISSRTSKETVTWFSLSMNCILLWGQDPVLIRPWTQPIF